MFIKKYNIINVHNIIGRCYVSVVLLNGIIYAMGGFDGHHRLGSAEKYDFERNQWTMIAPMTSQRSDACATVMNGKCNVINHYKCYNNFNFLRFWHL